MIKQLVEEQKKHLTDPMKYLLTDLELSQVIARIADNIVVELLHNSMRRCMSMRYELVLAFLGPLEEHQQHYMFLLGAFEQGAALLNNPTLQQQTAEIIRNFEAKGLARSEQWLANNISEPVPVSAEGPGLSQPGR